MIFLVLLMPFYAGAGIIKTEVKSTIMEKDRSLKINYAITNKGTETASRLIITTFLAAQTDHSNPLGDLAAGGRFNYNCELDIADLLPGNYIAATRIVFSDQSGQPHRIYHFSEITIKRNMVKKDAAVLSVDIKEPRFNQKSFWHPQGKFELVLKNNSADSVQPIVAFFLPDGFTTAEPEKAYLLPAAGTITEKIPVSIDSSIKQDSPYHFVVWYDFRGIHYSQRIPGTIRVVEEPFYFKAFLIAFLILLTAGVIFAVFRSRRKKSAAP